MGNVIGINSRIAGPTDVNLHVPVDIFRDNWDRLVKGEAWQPTLPSRNGPDVKVPFRQVVERRQPMRGPHQMRRPRRGPGNDRRTRRLDIDQGQRNLSSLTRDKPKGKITCRLRDGRELEAANHWRPSPARPGDAEDRRRESADISLESVAAGRGPVAGLRGLGRRSVGAWAW